MRSDTGHPNWSIIVLQASGITGDNKIAGAAWCAGGRGQTRGVSRVREGGHQLQYDV